MAKKISLRNKSIIYTWLVSYILMMLIQTIVISSIYFQTKKEFENEINKSNTFLLGRIKQQMDSLLLDVGRLGMEIAYDSNIKDVLNFHETVNAIEQIQINKAVETMKNYGILNKGVSRMYLYLKGIDMVIGQGMAINSSEFIDIFGKDIGVIDTDWKDITQGAYKGDFFSVSGSIDKEKQNSTLLYVLSLPVTNSSPQVSANLVIVLEDKAFFNDAKGIESIHHGEVFIINKDNQLMTSLRPMKDKRVISYETMLGDTGTIYENINGEKYAYSYITSNVKGWKYVSAVPAALFWEKAQYIQKLILFSLLLCLALGGIITYLALKKNYNPIKRMVSSLEGKMNMGFDKKHNEFGFIQQAIEKTVEENKHINNRLFQQSKVLRTNFIASLLKGKERGVPVEELLTNYEIHFTSDYFAVMAIHIEQLDSDFYQNKAPNTADPYKLIHFIFTNVFEELVAQKHQGFMTDVDEMLFCLINFRSEGLSEWKNEIYRVVNEAQEFISTHYKIDFIASVSILHEKLESIPEAYNEALQTMEYKKVMGVEKMMFFDDIDHLRDDEYFYPMDKEYQVINCIKAGDYLNAKEIIEEIFHRNFDHGRLSIQLAKCLMMDMISTMLKTMNEVEKISHNSFIEELNPIGMMNDCKTVNQMKQRMLQVFEKVCNYMTSDKKDTDYKIRDGVFKLVEENYQDENFGIQTIADTLNLSVSYISRTFKEQTEKGLLDYISIYRIGKAKELLKTSEENMDVIAGKVGYNNARTFTRAFKRYEGTTPGKFKA